MKPESSGKYCHDYKLLGENTMSKKTLIAAAVGTAFAATLGVAPIVSAADSPFAMQSLDRGYMVAQAGKTADGKCGQGKCGGMKAGAAGSNCAAMDADKDGKVSKEEFMKGHEAMFARKDANKDGFIDKDEMGKMTEGKCGEGKCGGDSKEAEGKCGEGKCGGDKKDAEGKCGEGKCGGDKAGSV